MALITTGQMAARTPYAVTTITNWKRRYEDFPKPVEVYGRVELYDEKEFDEWFREHQSRKRT